LSPVLRSSSHFIFPYTDYSHLYILSLHDALPIFAYKNVPYDPLKDFEPVALAAQNYLALVTTPDSPFKTVPEMIEWAKANKGKIDRKSTRLNSSHVKISYAVFSLQK